MRETDAYAGELGAEAGGYIVRTSGLGSISLHGAEAPGLLNDEQVP